MWSATDNKPLCGVMPTDGLMTAFQTYVLLMYICMRKFTTCGSYSLSSHECTHVGHNKKTYL